MTKLETIPQYFQDRAKTYGTKKVAMRQKEFGIWNEYSWKESYESVREFALGLTALGMERGDHVVTVGDNDRQYFWGYYAILAMGGVHAGMYTDTTSKEMVYLVNFSDAKWAFAKDQEQCDKLLEIKDEIPNIQKIVYWEERGLWGYDDPLLINYEEVIELGRKKLAAEPDFFEQEIAKGSREDVAALCFTSGTTGLPKAVMLTHDNMIQTVKMAGKTDHRYPEDNHVSFLPMGWIAEHIIGVTGHAVDSIIVNFPEEPETVRENIREIAPEGVIYGSRQWDSVVGLVQVKMNEASRWNQLLFATFLPIAYRVADRRMVNKPIPPWLALGYAIGDLLIFGPLRDNLGMSNMRYGYTGGAALSPDVMRFFHALGINLKQIYGSTEVSGGIVGHRDGDIKFQSIGLPYEGAGAKISDEGEIWLSGPSVFKGYYKNDEATQKSIQVDEKGVRWFKTGDAGYIDEDGHIIYLDRLKDMLTLRNGEKYSPQFLEGRLKFNPYVRDVMAVGGETRDYVTALVVIEFANAGNWAEKNRIGYTTFTDLSQKDEIYELVRKAVVEVNSSLPETGQLRRFVLMHKEFDADEAEMTRSRKLRRGVLYEKYSDIIEAMYAGDEMVKVKTIVSYQDGSEGLLETNLKIMTV